MLSFAPQKCLKLTLTDKNITEFARNVLATQEPASHILSRLSDLISISISKLGKFSEHLNGIVFQLIQFVSLQPARDFFATILSDDKAYKQAQKVIYTTGFVPILLTYVGNRKFCDVVENIENPYASKEVQHLIGIFYVIAKAASSPLFIEHAFKCPIMHSFFSRVYFWHDNIEDARWAALAALHQKSTSKNFNPYISHIISQLTEPFTKITNAKLSALAIITDMLKYNVNLATVLNQTSFHQVILRLLAQFPDHTSLQNKIKDLIVFSLENEHLRHQFAQNLINPLIEMANSNAISALRANSFEILAVVAKSYKMHGNLAELSVPEDFPMFVEDILQPRMFMLSLCLPSTR